MSSTNNQTALDHHLIEALFEVVPEDWQAFRFTVTPAAAEGAPPVLALFNPDVAGAEGTPSAQVRDLVGQIVALLAEGGRPWPQLTYSGHLGADGEWRLRVVAPLPE
ncbi:hypothetical protein [Xanthobacter oligotrophicus]|uniref:hypothetical protein n=1 Tax=Xanthobacter oligotrophicus TaxID=2607286 RepID=UPI0011F23FA9|nr:hypothetical protein [Xanthobacter oligotrophicus]MCG5233974.1 hypothetical protein [Xanthobacter oligotrophicus]